MFRHRRPMLVVVALAVLGCSDGGANRSGQGAVSASPRAEFEAVAASISRSDDNYFGRADLERAESIVSSVKKSGAKPRFEALIAAARERLEFGDVDRALEYLGEVERTIDRDPIFETRRAEVQRAAGLAWLRKAEVENCLLRNNAECCLFPFAGGGKHGDPAPALEALRRYSALYRASPESLDLAWVLSILSRAVAEVPEWVPSEALIPAERFDPEGAVGRFVNTARAKGVDRLDLCGGVVVEDFDRDGRLDIVTSTSDPAKSMAFYRGRPGFAYEDATASAGLDGQLGGLNCIGGDYDGDGDVDLFVLRGAWLYENGRIRNSLLRNDGGRTFVDVSHETGIGAVARPTQAAVFADFDGDGDLDLYVVNESRREMGDLAGDYPAELYLNDGHGGFRECAAESGVTNDRYAKGVAAGDFDDDGDIDIYVSNIGPNRLYRNDGHARFTDVAVDLAVHEPVGRSFACWFFDYDNDGRLDLFVAGFSASLADAWNDRMGRAHGAERPRLYRNVGGRFEDVTRRVGLDGAWLPMGANFGDIDNDGFLDVYLATGDPSFETLVPNVMLRNENGRRFVDVTTAGGLGHLQKGHGVAFADLDGDGDQDVYNQLGGFYPGDAFHNALFLNPGNSHRSIALELEARTGNPTAVGARLDIVVEGPSGRRTIHRALGSVSSFGGSPLRQEIGIGDAETVVSVDVRWPTSKARQKFGGMAIGQAYRLREGVDVPQPLARD